MPAKCTLLDSIRNNIQRIALAGKVEDRHEAVRKNTMRQCESAAELAVAPEPAHTDASVPPWKQCVKEFSMELGDGKLVPDLLGDLDCVPELFNCGSTLEEIFAVFSNVLMVDEYGTPTNREHAYYRSAQCVRQWSVLAYEGEPRFAGWEVELH